MRILVDVIVTLLAVSFQSSRQSSLKKGLLKRKDSKDSTNLAMEDPGEEEIAGE